MSFVCDFECFGIYNAFCSFSLTGRDVHVLLDALKSSPPTETEEMVSIPRSELAEALAIILIEQRRIELAAQIEPQGQQNGGGGYGGQG